MWRLLRNRSKDYSKERECSILEHKISILITKARFFYIESTCKPFRILPALRWLTWKSAIPLLAHELCADICPPPKSPLSARASELVSPNGPTRAQSSGDWWTSVDITHYNVLILLLTLSPTRWDRQASNEGWRPSWRLSTARPYHANMNSEHRSANAFVW